MDDRQRYGAASGVCTQHRHSGQTPGEQHKGVRGRLNVVAVAIFLTPYEFLKRVLFFSEKTKRVIMIRILLGLVVWFGVVVFVFICLMGWLLIGWRAFWG